MDELGKAEPITENLKTQLNDLCRFSRDMGAQSDRVSAVIKEYNRYGCRIWTPSHQQKWSITKNSLLLINKLDIKLTWHRNIFSFLSFFPSLSLQASRECQSKQKQLEQGFRSAFREFQQWLVNAKINTAKCFDVPQNLNEASASLLKIQVECIRELNCLKHL